MTSQNSIWLSDGSGPMLLESTWGEQIDAAAERHANKTFLTVVDPGTGSEVRYSYGEIGRRSDQLARGMRGWGVQKGDHVGLLAANSLEWVLIEFALAKIGAVLVTLNPAYKRAEIAYVLQQGRISTLFVDAAYRGYDLAAALVEEMPDLACLGNAIAGRVAAGSMPDLKRLCTVLGPKVPGSIDIEALEDQAAKVSETELARCKSEVEPADTVQIQYTSGTTGTPKGAMLSHRSTINNSALVAERAGYSGHDIMISAMPLFHTAGGVTAIMTMLLSGAQLICLSSFDAECKTELMFSRRATILMMAPTMAQRMLELYEADPTRYGPCSLRYCFTGGTLIAPSLMRKIHDVWGASPMIVMAMTECAPVITQTCNGDNFERKLTTAGTPLPHTDVMVVDPETAAPVPIGERGELWVRGYCVTKGYFDMPGRTAEAFAAGSWFRSGDMVTMTRSGHLSVVGRYKDMVIRGGENVYPVEIENYLLTHPSVRSAAVVGVPDPDMGEEIFAFIQTEDMKLCESKLLTYCGAGLARHKRPKYFVLLDEFPMTASGKIKKFELRKQAEEHIRNRQCK